MANQKTETPEDAEAIALSSDSSGTPTGLEHFLDIARLRLQKGAQRQTESLATRQHAITLEQLETFPEFHRRRPNISQNQLEWIYRHRHQNGFAKAFKKIGKLRYVVVPIFTDLLLTENRED